MKHDGGLEAAPLFAPKDYEAPSMFTPQNLLREARRQKGLPPGTVPEVCVLDPDGDLVDHLQVSDRLSPHHTWACYLTRLDTFAHEDMSYGIIGRVVGAPFAVLVAEELFASGCQLLISITSAGQILPLGPPLYVILIKKALREMVCAWWGPGAASPARGCQLDDRCAVSGDGSDDRTVSRKGYHPCAVSRGINSLLSSQK